MTLVLGQPGSGKSALMQVLSGRFPIAKNMTLSGDITYNGQTQQEIKHQLPQFVSYVTQRDKHFAVLTVRETLEFAHKFCGGELIRRDEELLTQGTPEENDQVVQVAKELFDCYPDLVIRQLGLQDCEDTIVGDALMRGISGGEKKRVTTGEMEFGLKYVTLMDEISTGLDSAATFDIITTQRSVARKFNKTVVIALLQPAPEVVALFDDILILNAGEVMYHGPMEEVVAYFAGLGFECPPGRDVADYLMDLGTKQQYQYQVEIPERNYVHPREPSEFASIFRDSHLYQATLRKLEEPLHPTLLENVHQHTNPMPEFHQSFWQNTRQLLYRQMLITVRNKPYIFGRGLMITVMGLLYATSFYQFDPKEIQVVIGIIFAASLFLSLGQASQLPTFMAARDIFYKQRGANFFRTFSYVLANSVSQLPLCVAETLIFGTLVYWMCGFVSHASKFFLFLLVLFLTDVSLGSFYFSLTAASKDINIATPISMAATLIFIIFAGFVITESQIPTYFIWLYWMTPVSWTLRALVVIEYRSRDLDVCEYGDINYCAEFDGLRMGEYYLQLYDFKTERVWILYCVIYMVVFYVCCMTLGYFSLEYLRFEPSNRKESIELLKGVSGYALPGKMTALMGAWSMEDDTDGPNDLAIRRCTGYCEQMDMHSEAATIREALTFNAFLRQDSEVPDSVKYDSVNECLTLLDMWDIADQIIRGSSTEQMKRLTIGVELAAQPSVLFLDEPTSGLDARSAKLIMDGVRKVANSGRTIVSLLFGITVREADYKSYQSLNSGMGMIFMATLFNGMISFQCVLSVSSADRPAFYRERATQTYNAFWYFVGSTVVEVPDVFGSAFVFTAIFFPMVQFTGFGTFLLYWVNTSFLILMLTYMGQMFVYALPSEEVAAIIGVLVNSIFFLFMGFSPPANLIPSGYHWLYTITPQRFSLAILGSLVFADCPEEPVYDEMTTGAGTVKQFTEEVFGMKHDEIWINFCVVLGYIVLFRVLALLALWFINSQKR
ncbi:hypothetical protein JG687_00014482 [Phytophthora cactorum]|uniref:ABC transporter domain-containing protein n=1 Tax=Phytophthora cactorum TaxID=29920 RepID=A0A8T1TXM2_9STRA|nr:hypothetical protein JG687_00014482 [Phytophthora cactorum]